MELNEKIKCPSCDKEISKLAHICIHCRVNLLQHEKDHLPVSEEHIPISNQTTSNLRKNDFTQRKVNEPLINKKTVYIFILFICFLIFSFLGLLIIEKGKYMGIAFEILILIFTLPITIAFLIGIWKHYDNSHKNILKDCEICGHPNHPDSNSCKNCGKELDTVGWFTYVVVIIGIWLNFVVIKSLIS
jgi:hypothetical protein